VPSAGRKLMSPPGSPCFVAGGKSGPRRKDKSDWPPGVPGRCSGSDLRGATLLFAQSPHVGIPLEAESSPGSVVRRRSPTSRAVRDLIEPTLCRPVPRSTCTVRWFLRRGLDKFIWHMQPCGSGCGWSSASRPACGTWRTRLRRALSSADRPPDALLGSCGEKSPRILRAGRDDGYRSAYIRATVGVPVPTTSAILSRLCIPQTEVAADRPACLSAESRSLYWKPIDDLRPRRPRSCGCGRNCGSRPVAASSSNSAQGGGLLPGQGAVRAVARVR